MSPGCPPASPPQPAHWSGFSPHWVSARLSAVGEEVAGPSQPTGTPKCLVFLLLHCVCLGRWQHSSHAKALAHQQAAPSLRRSLLSGFVLELGFPALPGIVLGAGLLAWEGKKLGRPGRQGQEGGVLQGTRGMPTRGRQGENFLRPRRLGAWKLSPGLGRFQPGPVMGRSALQPQEGEAGSQDASRSPNSPWEGPAWQGVMLPQPARLYAALSQLGSRQSGRQEQNGRQRTPACPAWAGRGGLGVGTSKPGWAGVAQACPALPSRPPWREGLGRAAKADRRCFLGRWVAGLSKSSPPPRSCPPSTSQIATASPGPAPIRRFMAASLQVSSLLGQNGKGKGTRHKVGRRRWEEKGRRWQVSEVCHAWGRQKSKAASQPRPKEGKGSPAIGRGHLTTTGKKGWEGRHNSPRPQPAPACPPVLGTGMFMLNASPPLPPIEK